MGGQQLILATTLYWWLIIDGYVLWNVQTLLNMLGKVPGKASLLVQTRWCTQHNWQGLDHSMVLRSGMVDSTTQKSINVQDRLWLLPIMCMIITWRLCNIMWWRKWYNLPPQTLMVGLWSYLSSRAELDAQKIIEQICLERIYHFHAS